MKILLDECVPRRVKDYLAQHEVQTVPDAGWAGKKNGELLELAQGRFDVFLTVDQNLGYQQNLTGSAVAVVLLLVADNSIDSILPLLSELQKTLLAVRPGEMRIVGS
jgi:predicted nuclease of predicted toxin-antitoxin system